MKNGDTRRGPLSRRISAVSAIVCNPPMPEPIITPVRSRSVSSSGFQPASLTACSAAAIANKMKVSTLRISLDDHQSSALNVPSEPSPNGTSQAIRVANPLASNRVIGPAPDRPATRRLQVSSTPQARGETMPMPVITTRRIRRLRLGKPHQSLPKRPSSGKPRQSGRESGPRPPPRRRATQFAKA